MPVVSEELLWKHAEASKIVSKALNILEHDDEVQALLEMANVMAVNRLKFNDHGLMHARIVAGAALEMMSILSRRGVKPSSLRDGVCANEEEVKLVVLLGAYLHDIGNSVHREMHWVHGAAVAKDIVIRVLKGLGFSNCRSTKLACEVLHIIFSHDERIQCLSLEAGIVKVADGTDMAEERARLPYKLGKTDIHALSALSIKRVEIEEGHERPIAIKVHMIDWAGVFQIEEVLMKKLATSGIEKYVEVVAEMDGNKRVYKP